MQRPRHSIASYQALWLIAFLSFFPSSFAIEISVNLALKCPSSKYPLEGTVVLMEEDIFTDDQISDVFSFKKTPPIELPLTAKAGQFEWIFDNYLEPYLLVSHNCDTKSAKDKVKTRVNLPQCNSQLSSCVYNQTIDLSTPFIFRRLR